MFKTQDTRYRFCRVSVLKIFLLEEWHVNSRRNIIPVALGRRLEIVEQALNIICAAGLAFLHPQEDLRRVGKGVVGVWH